jgi:hypothetical protein
MLFFVSRLEKAMSISSIDTGYTHFSTTPGNMHEHFPLLSQYTEQCSHVTELGSGELTSCWALLHGLKRSKVSAKKELVCVDIKPAHESFDKVSAISSEGGVKMKFIRGNSLDVKMRKTDMLLIDTFHAYPQLKKELAKHEGVVDKYIAILNTAVDGEMSELVRMFYYYDIDAVCADLRCTHKEVCLGLRPAIDEFLLGSAGEWEIAEDLANNNGLIILKRKKVDSV